MKKPEDPERVTLQTMRAKDLISAMEYGRHSAVRSDEKVYIALTNGEYEQVLSASLDELKAELDRRAAL